MRSAQAGFKDGKGKSGADWLAEIGPTLRVDIGWKSRTLDAERPDLPAKQIHALVDTGAGANCIDEALAIRLGLPVTDEGETSGVHGVAKTTFYLARIYIPELDRLLFERLAGARLEGTGIPHRAILGRPFLRPYRVAYHGITGVVEIIEP